MASDWTLIYDGYATVAEDGRYHILLDQGVWWTGGKWIVLGASLADFGSGGRIDLLWSDSLAGPWNGALPFGYSDYVASAAYGEGVWMVVSRSVPYTVFTSPDMVTWTSRSSIVPSWTSFSQYGWLFYVGDIWTFVATTGQSAGAGGVVYTASSKAGPWSEAVDFNAETGESPETAYAAAFLDGHVVVATITDDETHIWRSSDPSDSSSWAYATIDYPIYTPGGVPLHLGAYDGGFFICGTDNKVYTSSSLSGAWALSQELTMLPTISQLQFNPSDGWLLFGLTSGLTKVAYSGDSLDSLESEEIPSGLTGTLRHNGEEWLLGAATGLWTRPSREGEQAGWGLVLA